MKWSYLFLYRKNAVKTQDLEDSRRELIALSGV